MVYQKKVTLTPYKRGFHLITFHLEKELSELLGKVNNGIAHLFLLHTSASLSLNENSDPDVRTDLETFTNAMIPETFSQFAHTYEGSDDMPAHVKSSLYGASVVVPVSHAHFILGTWQGIYFNEHRNNGGMRSIFCTLIGS